MMSMYIPSNSTGGEPWVSIPATMARRPKVKARTWNCILELRFKNETHKLFLRDCRPVIWSPDIEKFEVSLAQADEAFKATKASL